MTDSVLLKLPFEMENLEFVSMKIMLASKWKQMKRKLELLQHIDKALIQAYSNPSPIECHGEAFNARKVLEKIEVITDPKRVEGFRACFGEDFYTENDLLGEVEELLFPVPKQGGDRRDEEKYYTIKIFGTTYYGETATNFTFKKVSGWDWRESEEKKPLNKSDKEILSILLYSESHENKLKNQYNRYRGLLDPLQKLYRKVEKMRESLSDKHYSYEDEKCWGMDSAQAYCMRYSVDFNYRPRFGWDSREVDVNDDRFDIHFQKYFDDERFDVHLGKYVKDRSELLLQMNGSDVEKIIHAKRRYQTLLYGA